jgi:uncharacterized membrane-anchored protein
MLGSPALILMLVLASVYALVFYLWQGQRIRDLVFFWLAAVVGVAAGQIAGSMLALIPWTIGQVHVVEATLVAFFLLVIARWLRQERQET